MPQGSIRGGQPLEFTDTGPSRQLWKDCPWDDIGRTIRGVKHKDYFTNFPTSLVNTSNITQKYKTWVDTGGTIVQSLTDPLGSAVIQLDTTTNDAGSIQTGNLASFVDPAVSTPYDVWMEARFSLATITDNFFLGLMAYAAPATAALITDAGVLGGTGDIGFVGFSALEGTPTVMAFTYKKNGQTVQIPIANLLTAGGVTGAIVAGTKYSVGIHYRIANPAAQKISIFKNNVLQSVGVTAANIAAATFPDAVPMALTAAVKNQTTTLGAGMTLNWWRFAMVEN